MKGHLFILSGPSGVGKNAVEKKLRKRLPDLQRLITYTTRKPRPQEKDGVDYHFTSRQHFKDMVDKGEMLEWAVVHDQLYGNRMEDVQNLLDDRKDVLMILDVQGAVTIKEKMPEAHLIFIEPESLEQLKKHILKRRKANSTDMELRLENAKKEIAMRGFYDHAVINHEGEIKETADQIAEFIKKFD